MAAFFSHSRKDVSFDDLVNVVKLTQYGRQYLAENPRLCNPTDWAKWAAVAAAASVLISIIALLVAC